MIGHDLQAGTRKSINTGNGVTVAYAHTLCLETHGIKIDNVLIDFMPNLKRYCQMLWNKNLITYPYSVYST